MEGTLSESDNEAMAESEIPLYCRFLSYFVFSHGITGDEVINILAKDFWDTYKTWAKRNNFKLKANAAQFAAELAEFSQFTDSGLTKARQGNNQLVFTLHTPKMHSCLQSNALLDPDVW